MIAAVLREPKQFDVQQVAIPEPAVGEVRIRLKMVGVCGSDVHLFLGHRRLDHPLTIGHEGLGYIDKIGEGVVGREPGERVVIEPNIPCLHCRPCRSGRGNICTNKKVVGLNRAGCFAEYVTLPAEYAWRIPDAISDQDAVTVEPTAVCVHALFTAKAKPGDSIAVIGLGAIGLLLTHLALALGYRVLVLEIDAGKLKTAVGLGAIPLTPAGSTVAEQANYLNRVWEENQVSAIFECAGVARTASIAAAAAPRGSEIILVGLSGDPATFQPLKIAREGISILPSIVYDHPFDFNRVIRLISAGVIRPGFIISRYMALKDIQSALETASKGVDSKIIINI